MSEIVPQRNTTMAISYQTKIMFPNLNQMVIVMVVVILYLTMMFA